MSMGMKEYLKDPTDLTALADQMMAVAHKFSITQRVDPRNSLEKTNSAPRSQSLSQSVNNPLGAIAPLPPGMPKGTNIALTLCI